MSITSLKDILAKYYDIEPFAIGLHTTIKKETADTICHSGLKTGVRALEGTLKIFGDFNNVSETDLNYFFSDTNYTLVIAIPSLFDTPRIKDNLGGDSHIWDFSKFVSSLESILPHYKSGDYLGLLPCYYIMGYYDRNFKFTQNPDCYIINENSKKYLLNDFEEYKNNQLFIKILDSLSREQAK